MRKYLSLSFLMLLLLSLGIEMAFSQTVELRVGFPSYIDADKLIIEYDNGKQSKDVKPVIVNNEWILKDSIFDPYSLISFYYKNEANAKSIKGVSFWLSDKAAEIVFHGDSARCDNPLEHYTLRNVISQNEIEEKMTDSIIGRAWVELDDYYFRNYDSIRVNPLKMDTFTYKRNAIVEKELERVRTQAKDYFILHHFNSSVVRMRSGFTSKELLSFFEENFPDSLKNTYKGKQIAASLRSRISSKKGGEAPDFNTKAINGDEVALKSLRGKYVILDFWASWCVPCIKIATPKLKEIRKKYSRDKLEIVSVTLDEDYNKYQNALRKLDTSFIDVFDGKQIVKDYGVTLIPQIILIHPDGTIVYNREEESDADLLKLENMLGNIFEID